MHLEEVRRSRGLRVEGHGRVAPGRRVVGQVEEHVRMAVAAMERGNRLGVAGGEHRSILVVGEVGRSLGRAGEDSDPVEEEEHREELRRVVEDRGVVGSPEEEDVLGEDVPEEDMRRMAALLHVRMRPHGDQVRRHAVHSRFGGGY